MKKKLGGRTVTTRQIREYRRRKGLDVSREEVIEIWWERRRGERKKFSGGFLQNENHRRYLIQALVEECKRDGKEYPTVVDFRTTKLAGLFVDYYKNSVFQALTEARFTNPESEYYDPAL